MINNKKSVETEKTHLLFGEVFTKNSEKGRRLIKIN